MPPAGQHTKATWMRSVPARLPLLLLLLTAAADPPPNEIVAQRGSVQITATQLGSILASMGMKKI